jgi:hypothetical protein
MFVVAQLARSQGIRVTLTPSPAYGGTKAVVLIPSDLIDAEGSPDETSGFPRQPPAGRLSPVGGRPALVHSQPAPNGPESGPIDSLHERMALGGREFSSDAIGLAKPAQDGDAWPTSIADQLDRALPSLSPARVQEPDTQPPGLPVAGGRPELPRRRRQAHLDDRLRTPPVGSPQTQGQTQGSEPAADPETARNRMAAFQRGTRRGRAENADGENPNPRG